MEVSVQQIVVMKTGAFFSHISDRKAIEVARGAKVTPRCCRPSLGGFSYAYQCVVSSGVDLTYLMHIVMWRRSDIPGI